MSTPYSYLVDHDKGSQGEGDGRDTTNVSDLMESTATGATTATLTDGSSTYDGINTPSTTDDGIDTPISSDPARTGIRGTQASGLALPEPAGMLSSPELTVLLHQIQQAAEDVSQLVGRFGFKMADKLSSPCIKRALFADHKLLRLPCLKYADDFTCRVTRFHTAGQPIYHENSAPLLWWLWDALLDHLPPRVPARGRKLEFTPAHGTDIPLPYNISVNLESKCDKEIIELTAWYGGLFHERRIFDAPVARFCFPETKRYGKPIEAPLNIDRRTYQGEGCLAHTFDYLMPRPGSPWRLAMKAFPPDKEEALVVALAGTCKAEDDHVYLAEDQDRQCRNLLQRVPPDAKEYIRNEKLVGKTGGPYSKTVY
ncbi:hypothetical protein H2204_011657 [Knufia peltigerae]|uniref:Uncharacterized protein n=1 Tax=Knufia peltigerae TaxID=1002370 RepID=A0AA38XTY6_9EURO|nr:hypothetical protein H2204_011657 [Knufia peltigerae]